MTVIEVLPWITTITAVPILFVTSVLSRAALAGGGTRISLRTGAILSGLCLLSMVALAGGWVSPETAWVIVLEAVAIVVNVAVVAVSLRHLSMTKNTSTG